MRASWPRLLRTGMLRAVYHGENGLRTLRELARSYHTIGKDLIRVMNRLKALYRGWGIACAGTQVYAPRYREEWLSKLPQAGVRRRAELLYQQLDGLQALRRNLRPEFLAESRKHKAAKLLRQIPCIGPIRAARLIALMQPRTGSAASGNCGPIAAWALKPTTVRNTDMWADKCSVPKSRSRSAVSIRTTTMR